MLYLSKTSAFILNWLQLDFKYSRAIVADSDITLPKLPVIESLPFPFDKVDSINNISPPTLVHANPVTTPAISFDSYLSLKSLAGPSISVSISGEILGLYSIFVAMFFAQYLTILAIFFSKPLTPDSLV